ncbi:MAG: Gfo/Idh/MocA family oxidoreductase [Gemmatimonadetes bacterium]|uniref:Gfo/Idh/MocA family oxidoreductase n=1 Tax=Candidatus Kutchimonas denitrificans TaxID=3056748 RepID=A0AAE5CB13_9BACT|nr:Gfo/Idh/MocA family oxidoreductase [Gemmatimonadota bacterium]NIR73935.1 Gfo/Idh/MocA family oxidoreductase [Candidatus Kutchimonas denitrificans]NIR99741.1 Gfo/Idh/MocA family oxidoreductase [Gemmatimonadota bacterium]NIT65326.1 Gfo/Idh/MocA family oxidoreductase [Gemmatimonadota bacterium]NIW73775.1 Gfo/Idh/MocA family oxidoreductase [Gemmatimonadota bacterium]
MTTGKSVVDVGIVGCGAIAQLVHLPVLAGMDGVDVAAVCDINLPKAKLVAERFQVPAVYSSVDELFEHSAIGAVVVCTPNDLHAEHCEAALRAGFDVLVERPLGINQEQVAHTLDVARETAHSLMVANNHRFRPDAWALRRFISAGELGEIFHIHSSWQRRRARRPRVSEWRMSRVAGGGVLMDLGITNLDAALWLIDYPKPERLTAYLLDRDQDEVDDSAVVLIRLDGNLTCSVEVSWDLAAIEDRHSLVAMGSHGYGSLSPFNVQKETGGKIVDVTPRLAPGTENVYRASYQRELDYFLAVVRGEREEPLPEEQLTLMKIVDACYRSSEEGREIVL